MWDTELLFWNALGKDKSAMETYSKMDKKERDDLLNRASLVTSPWDMEILIGSLGRINDANEYF